MRKLTFSASLCEKLGYSARCFELPMRKMHVFRIAPSLPRDLPLEERFPPLLVRCFQRLVQAATCHMGLLELRARSATTSAARRRLTGLARLGHPDRAALRLRLSGRGDALPSGRPEPGRGALLAGAPLGLGGGGTMGRIRALGHRVLCPGLPGRRDGQDLSGEPRMGHAFDRGLG